jgi:hypothetical protein
MFRSFLHCLSPGSWLSDLVVTRQAFAFAPCDEVTMKIVGKAEIETVADVVCDACTISTRVRTGANEYEFVTARL